MPQSVERPIARLRHQSQRRRVAVAFVALILHVALITAFSSLSHLSPPRMTPAESITWLTLMPPAPEADPQNERTPAARVPVQTRRIPLPVQPPLPGRQQARTPEVLQSYVLCGLPVEQLLPEQRERCAKLRLEMHPNLPEKRTTPTEEEKVRDLRLAHDLAVQRAPPLLPCVVGSINVML